MEAQVYRRSRHIGKYFRSSTLGEAIGLKKAERILFITPHDDDAAIGAGMAIMRAVEDDVTVHVAIVTDGSMGYRTLVEAKTIVKTRQRESARAYRALGVREEHIHWLGFPDGSTWQHVGGRDYGMERPMTKLLRLVRPSAVFTACAEDAHPDHKAVNMEVRMALFHAAGGIWRELGRPLKARPTLLEWATYGGRPAAKPDVFLTADQPFFRRKLKAIVKWASQTDIIEELICQMRQGSPKEKFWIIP